ncbi:hypothetical protein [Geotoga petraea]|uniref:Beta-propeller repeat-containing protein n=1 Tax=Geotoga petraea TaxID=28234 RepID=A0A4Z0W0Z9_9BACT|nr:hypothetical protein [Geotoga petraea]TGG88753.1 hypothetical protein E4650_00710 [Geotoga petraea]
MKKIVKYIFLSSGLIVVFVFVLNIILALTGPDSNLEYLVTSGNANGTSFNEYINQEGTVPIKSKYSYFTEIDEPGVVFTKIIKFKDDKYFILGYNAGENILFETDISGNVLSKRVIEKGNVRFYDLTYFNNVINFVGEKENKPYILSINESGSKLWSEVYNFGGSFSFIKPLSTGYLIGGYKYTENNKQSYILEINEVGTKIWEDTYGRSDDEELLDAFLFGSQIYTVGNTNSNPRKQKDLLFLRYSTDGIRNFQGEYGDQYYDEYPASIIIDKEGYVYVGGYSIPSGKTTWQNFFFKSVKNLEENGEIKTLKFDSHSIQNLSRITSMVLDNDNLYMGGFSVEKWPDYNGFIRINNKNGVLIEQKIYGKSDEERFYDFIIANDKSVIAVGYIKRNDIVYPLLMKTDSDLRIPEYER